MDLAYSVIDCLSADNFILKMLSLGKPIEVSLVGSFEEGSGIRGSRRDVELPLHRDGDYSKDIASKNSIDWVGLYCLREGDAVTLIESNNEIIEVKLKKGQAVIFDNKLCRHGRVGKVGNRVLLRVWIEKVDGKQDQP